MTIQTIEVLSLGVNNIRSIVSAITEVARVRVRVIERAEESSRPSFLVLPGTGAFGYGVASLKERGFSRLIRDEVLAGDTPILGVCLGMQLLAAGSDEAPLVEGLGLLNGRAEKLIAANEWKVPHVGWNTARIDPKISDWMPESSDIDYYFSHSYALRSVGTNSKLTTDFANSTFISAFNLGDKVYGAQFHPEKSSSNGLRFLKQVFGDHIKI